ncbi:MAG: hypothetical protein BWK76_14430 [Desulfobulbaceae bacterium A2]|nr:MAG: hypothetical protein BWK76_14430 [Desulfobulbaceae bacterium A2]
MRLGIPDSLAAGYGCLAAWADLLDRINVFPVADGDTGANLRVSLAPLRDAAADPALLSQRLGRCAIGNSGNIAAAFFRELCQAGAVAELAARAARGREAAWQAVAAPRAGTMLSVFDALADGLAAMPAIEPAEAGVLCREMRQAVLDGVRQVPELRGAGVVDAGALGMYVFFDGLLRALTDAAGAPASVVELFAGWLQRHDDAAAATPSDFCVDLRLRPLEADRAGLRRRITGLGDSVVVGELDGAELKVHVHTPDPAALRSRLGDLGEITHWRDERIEHTAAAACDQGPRGPLHIMTDGAASLTRELARQQGITLLDSYIVAEGESRPESLYTPEEIYPLLRRGHKVTTAQASDFERHQQYHSVCDQYGPTLYLCTGSAFTGNYAAASAWKAAHDGDDRLQLLDSGAASGRLGLMVLLSARLAQTAASADEVLTGARQALATCEEFVFIDQLRYLVAGGRVSWGRGLVGDLLHLKPVISPAPDGVRKLGVVRSREGQLAFALDRLRERFDPARAGVLLVQYSDNRDWVEHRVIPRLHELLPGAEILAVPLSLTSGVHMGPGTWSLACCAAPDLTAP